MIFGDQLTTNTILHEAVHSGTQPWHGEGGVPYIFDGGMFGSLNTYGTLHASLDRARYGWRYASSSAASYAWLVTVP